ncbi:MAG: hypothetical protein MUO59_05220 [Actinobacteria bacterium]|nr:hypothetical protein [Actinomycetota bacterium]
MEIWEILLISIIGVSTAGYLAWMFFGRRKKGPSCSSCPYSESCKNPDEISPQDPGRR